MTEAEKQMRRRDQAAALRKLALEALSPPVWDGVIRPGAICTADPVQPSPFWTLGFA